MSLAAGDLRHLVYIEAQADTRDPETGAPIAGWASVVTNAAGQPLAVPANIAPLSAREWIAGQAMQSEVSVRITIRWRPGIKAAMRLRRVDDGRIYNIAGVLEDPISGREYLTLPCSEGANNG